MKLFCVFQKFFPSGTPQLYCNAIYFDLNPFREATPLITHRHSTITLSAPNLNYFSKKQALLERKIPFSNSIKTSLCSQIPPIIHILTTTSKEINLTCFPKGWSTSSHVDRRVEIHWRSYPGIKMISDFEKIPITSKYHYNDR